ncbi:hypothetical protein C3747_33g229 [Trypanosoma cruzi]|uniref:PHD-type domain-containing protein n=2 Tax=Trypanosoma cruzi TaxID=5693 RepID=Q4DBW8_TRYCC|nr:hypothetical protein, conserved [Trypanosoma cruzi]EAN90022.1 hypothetical protein, conserved [Trypanosoma cruzi]PWV14769.1 hypothetical protein C3747_33g229 [Trypanosoma cruzi]RNC50904.1 hypothetical protein TcCL_ESM12031 [Trypanosoma cruzi]|eukprot:XP_811873.1 hypothetical protein [Trypanosoma cruzi strain CL Brener]
MVQNRKRKTSKAGDVPMRIALNYETVLPLVFVDNMDEVRAKYKPYKIIEEGLSDDSTDDEHTVSKRRLATSQPSRKRSRVPSTIDAVAKGFALPSARVGWGAQALRESTPYGLLRRRDLFDRCCYIMDLEDHVWCHEKKVPIPFFVDAITKLERKYVMHLEAAARGSEAPTNVDVFNGAHNNNNNNNLYLSGENRVELCGVCSLPELSEESECFLHCRRCGCQAHVKCWILEALPPNAKSWLCPCCVVARREKGVGRCHFCGRKGGVMLPFVSGVGWKSESSVGKSLFCHIVCSLALEELAIDAKKRVVHPVKRSRKSNHLARCVFCNSESAGACERCHHPRCFDSMHPSCAQQAGTLECYRAPHAISGTGPWDGCRLYCRAHFGVVVESPSGFAGIGEFAEAEALRHVNFADFVDEKRPVRRGRPPNARVTPAALDAVKKYWVKKRLQRLHDGVKIVENVQGGRCDIVSVSLRPEIMKITPTEVRLARFVCLIPELQHHINASVEGVLPIPDEEYDDVEEYRKAHSRTRYAGNTRKLYEKMQSVASHINVFCELAELLHQRAVVWRELLETDLQVLEARCHWGAEAN